MPRSELNVYVQSVQISDVRAVSMTPISQEVTEDGDYVREFRFVGSPETEGQEPPVVFVVRCLAAEKGRLEITTPNLLI